MFNRNGGCTLRNLPFRFFCCPGKEVARRTYARSLAPAEFPVRQMQPYVVAVLINAVANPLGVGSFVLSSLFFFLFIRPPGFFLFLISLATEQQPDYGGLVESPFGDYRSSEILRKMRKIADGTAARKHGRP